MVLAPYLKYAELVAALGAVALSGYIGYRMGTSEFKDYKIRAADEETKEVLHDSRVAQVAITKYVDRIVYIEKQVDPIIQEVVKEIEKPIYSECVVPESGRLLLDSAVTQANAAIHLDGAL